MEAQGNQKEEDKEPHKKTLTLKDFGGTYYLPIRKAIAELSGWDEKTPLNLEAITNIKDVPKVFIISDKKLLINILDKFDSEEKKVIGKIVTIEVKE